MLESTWSMRVASGDMKKPWQQAAELQASGIPGTATVKAIRPTGQLVNFEPAIEFDLEANIGGPPYPVTHSRAVPQALIPQVQPGATVNIKANRANPMEITLVLG